MKFLHHRVQKWLILLLGALLSFLAIIAWQHHSIAQQANQITLQ
jgi:hypothetical protein